MKKIIRIILLLLIVFSFSCEEQVLFINCQDCLADEPSNTVLDFNLNFINNAGVLLNIYEGKLEDDILIDSFNIFSAPFSYDASINTEYTVTATYNISGKEYVVVDSATPRVKFDKNQCDNPCYVVYDKVLNLKLKYTK